MLLPGVGKLALSGDEVAMLNDTLCEAKRRLL